MKRITGLYFSPRKIGNCFLTLKKIEELINEKIEIINVHEKNIEECKACYTCLNDKCKIEDDFNSIIEKIIESDLIIISVPVYILGPNSVFKKFIDRLISLYNIIEKVYNKNLIAISIAGVKEIGEGYTDLAMLASFEALGFRIIATETIYGALPAEVLLEEENLNKLEKISETILQEKSIKKNRCNYCSSRYFELNDDILKCLVCKSEYKLVKNELQLVKESKIFFGSLEKLKEHKKWLVNMKEKYMKNRERLKEIIKKYSRQ